MVAALLLPGVGVASVAWAQPAVAPAAAHEPTKKDTSVKVDKDATLGVPDAATLDYLGRYGDAADGLDPLGLAELDDGPAHEPPAREHQ